MDRQHRHINQFKAAQLRKLPGFHDNRLGVMMLNRMKPFDGQQAKNYYLLQQSQTVFDCIP
jgi:hypothetical protein